MRARGLLLLACIIAATGLLYWAVNPMAVAFAPKCLFRMFTGWSCPGCGLQRFIHAAVHGRFLEAISYNYMLVLLFPYILLFGIEKLVLKGEAQQRLKDIIEGKTATIFFCIVTVVWFVARNLLHI